MPSLAERRVAAAYQENQFAAFQTRIAEAAGFPVPVEVHWDTLMPTGEAHLYAESWSAVYFEPLVQALLVVARDRMGKDALKSGLKQIVIQNTKSVTYADGWASFDGGILRLDHEPLTNAYDSEGRKARLVKTLEQGL